MSHRNFRQLLEAQWSRDNFVCVGLDSCDEPRMRSVVDLTHDLVCSYKLNFAFYLCHGPSGLVVLQRNINHIKTEASDVPIILDCKDADIGSTNDSYAEYFFKILGVDAITTNPYLGGEALQPFLKYGDKGIFVLCRTSNPGAGEFQDLLVSVIREGCQTVMPLYKFVAMQVAYEWNNNSNCALVVGATYPKELLKVRRIVGDMPILIPGIDFQQKDVPLEEQVKQVVDAGKDSRRQGMIINSSRGIILAPDPRRATLELRDLINKYR